MPKFSANISTLFTERPMLERFAAAAAAGFAGVEIQFPYSEPADALAAAADKAQVAIALFNVPAGDMTSGGPGLACIPGREAEFRAAVADAARYARTLKPANVNVLAGRPPPGIARADCLAVLASNLRIAAEAMTPLGVGVVVEALNSNDVPGFLLTTSAAALEAIDRAAHPAIMLQYDVYHMHQMEGAVAETVARLRARIGHIQFADVPGRHEPGSGSLDFPSIFAAIDRSGYRGWVGAEYRPSGRTEDCLAWLDKARGA
ncbi:MAG TPA: TIM barrel protein [Alphaproteobacteria bacterium]